MAIKIQNSVMIAPPPFGTDFVRSFIMKALFAIFMAYAIFAACTSPQVNENRTADTLTKESRQIKIEKTFTGLYSFGDEVNIFRNCGDGAVYWVVDSLVDLRKAYLETNRSPSYPYESVYAEVRGYLAGKANFGYASEYPDVLVVTEVRKVEAKNFKTECYPYEFIALGNEPFWSVDIIPVEDRIVFKDAGNSKVIEFPYSAASQKGSEYQYNVGNEQKDTLEVVIRKESCSDGMSDRTYQYAAEVKLNGKRFQGCAIRKGDVLD